MKVYDYAWKVKDTTKPHRLWFVGDQHIGAAASAVGHLKETLEEIRAHPEDRLILMGDCCDFVNMSDKRFDVRQVAEGFHSHLDDLVRKQAETFMAIHESVAAQCIAILPGNHDELIRLKYHTDIVGWIGMELKVPVVHIMTQFRIYVSDAGRNYRFKGIASHAHKNAATLGGKMATTERMKKDLGDHDFFAQAHTHQMAAVPVSTLDAVGEFGAGRSIDRVQWIFLTGGYLKTYDEHGSGYGEKRGYSPTVLGSPYMSCRLKRTSYRGESDEHRSVDEKEFKGVA